jgi:hypothetical protein
VKGANGLVVSSVQTGQSMEQPLRRISIHSNEGITLLSVIPEYESELTDYYIYRDSAVKLAQAFAFIKHSGPTEAKRLGCYVSIGPGTRVKRALAMN